MHWCYMASQKLVEFSVWREVDPTKLLMTTLSVEEAHQYEKLLKLKLPKVPLTDNHNMNWLFALWGNANMIKIFLCIYFPISVYFSFICYPYACHATSAMLF